MINKLFIHVDTDATFNSMNVASNKNNTQWSPGGIGTPGTIGELDINWSSIVFIKESKRIWTHGEFYSYKVGEANKLSNELTIKGNGITLATFDGSTSKSIDLTYSSINAASATHDHTIEANASDDDIVILSGTSGNNAVSYSASHAKKGPASQYVSSNTTTEISGSGYSKTIKIPQLTVDTYGHVTSATDENITISLPSIPTKVSQLTNDKYYVTEDVNFEIIDKASINFKNTSTSVTMNYNTIEQNDSIGFDVNIPLATTEKAGAMSAADKSVIDTIVVNGDGTEFLSNDGTYEKLYCGINKEYENGVNTLGVKYLTTENSNVLTTNDINIDNTIYVVQGDFNLNGGTLSFPSNTVLKFDGGCLSNGTINGSVHIDPSSKEVFNNVTVVTPSNSEILLDWFVLDDSNTSSTINGIIANNAGKIIKCGSRTYKLSNPINIKTNTIIEGVTANGETTFLAQSIAFVFEENCRTCRFSNFSVASNVIGSNIAFKFNDNNGGAEIYLTNLKVNAFNIGLDIKETWWNNSITNCRFNDCNIGVNMKGTGGQCLVNKFDHCYFNQCYTGMVLASCKATTVINCNFGGVPDENCLGLQITTNSYVTVEGCNFETFRPASYKGALFITSDSNALIEGCTFLTISNANSYSAAIWGAMTSHSVVNNTVFFCENTAIAGINTAVISYSECKNVTTARYGYSQIYDIDQIKISSNYRNYLAGISTYSRPKCILLGKTSLSELNVVGRLTKTSLSTFSNTGFVFDFGILKGNQNAPTARIWYDKKVVNSQCKVEFGTCTYNSEEYYCIKVGETNQYSGGKLYLNMDCGYENILTVNESATSSFNKMCLYEGTTEERPRLYAEHAGHEYYDTTLGQKVIWNGNEWVSGLEPLVVDFDVAVMGGDEDTNLTFDIYDRMVEAWGKHQSIIFKYNDQYYRVLDYNINDGVDRWLCIYITADNNYPSILTLNVNTGAQLENSYLYSFYSSNLGRVATIAQNGLMSAEDKVKLNKLTTQVSTMPSTSDVQTMINDAITTVLNTEL